MKQYKPIIDDWEAFKSACEKPALSTVRKNSVRAGKNFEERLRQDFAEVKKSEWNSEVFRLPGEKTPGKSKMHWLGEYYVQEESASIPVEVLNPQRGERILDMCAAPGGKTTQIASKIGNKGVVVANDDSSQRLKSLHANVYRTGSASVSVTNYDGRRIPEEQKFDRILLDAPCSGEGDRARRNFLPAEQHEKENLSKLQKQLGGKVASLLKDGGTMVYSTCTINPQENEQVVRYLAENTELELKRIETEASHMRGVRSFESENYGKEMSKTVRVYPNHLNSGMIYVAKFVKPGNSEDEVEYSEHGSNQTDSDAWEYLERRFGVRKEDLTGFRIQKISGDYWLHTEKGIDLEFETKGIRCLRDTGRGLKPTTYILQLLEDEIEKNIVEVDKEELIDLLDRRKMIDREMEDEDYVALKYQGRIIGCGYYKNEKVSSRIPKGRSGELKKIIEYSSS
ncbi:MAG: NOL1/NOP2/sun family putative RNA methylase [Candidatus Nanohaloarchaea archaeon]|jgi:NOL1/NOP2/sun family putative RNA methylase